MSTLKMLTVSQEKQKDATRNAKWEEYTEVWGGALSSPAGGSRKGFLGDASALLPSHVVFQLLNEVHKDNALLLP